MSFRRRMMMAANSNPYIMDGCIGMWDAEWNNGFNSHSANTLVWKDLSPAGKDLSMREGGGFFTWENNRIRCLGNGYIASLPYKYSSFQTIECVFSIDDIVNDGTLNMQMILFAEFDTKGMMITKYNSTGVYAQCGTSNANNRIMVSSSSANFNRKIYQVSAVFSSPNSNNLIKSWCNGINRTLVGAINGAGGDFFTIGGTPLNRFVKGYIYSIRLYNRALSNDELTHNWLIDKKRFNIT